MIKSLLNASSDFLLSRYIGLIGLNYWLFLLLWFSQSTTLFYFSHITITPPLQVSQSLLLRQAGLSSIILFFYDFLILEQNQMINWCQYMAYKCVLSQCVVLFISFQTFIFVLKFSTHINTNYSNFPHF